MVDSTNQSINNNCILHSEDNLEVCANTINKCEEFPVHWDNLPQQDIYPTEKFYFSEQFVSKQLQSEYWWSRSKIACKSDCLKSCWLKLTSAEDERYELTEYQVVREVIWALMGAHRSFVYQYISNPKSVIANILVCAKRVSVNHLTPPALDSILTKFSIICTHANFLRLLLDHTNASFGFHPCISMFSNKIRSFLSSFEGFLCEIENKAREGSENITLILLYTRISIWSLRLRIIVNLVVQSTVGQLSSLTDKYSYVRVLDVIYTFTSTIDYYTDDKWLIDFLYSLFFHCFYPILSSVVHLLSGSLEFVHLKRLFLNIQFENLPSDPHSWLHLANELDKCTIDSSSIPTILYAKLSDLVGGVRSLGTILALATTGSDVSLLEPVRHSVAEIMRQLGISTSHVFDSAHVTRTPLNFNAVMLSSFQDDDFEFVKDHLWTSLQRADYSSPSDICINCKYTISSFQRILHEVIVYRCGVLNQYLMKLLITPTGYTVLNSRHLGSALSVVFAVYLFGASDKMCDFLRSLFLRTSDVDAWSKDLWGLTLSLRSLFERWSKSIRSGQSDCDLFITHFQRFSFKFIDSNKDDHQKGAYGQENILGLGPTFLAFDTEWPIDCVVDSRALTTYSSVFNFMVQIKYVKWSLETLPFKSLDSMYTADPVTHHRLLLLRVSMLHVFTSLHDFIMHRVESLRVHFSRQWHLPELPAPLRSTADSSQSHFPGDLSHLIRYHAHFLDELASVCLLTEEGSMLRKEITYLCGMVLTMRSIWLGAESADRRRAQFQTDLAHVSNEFASHVKFLATLLSRYVSQSSASRLLPLAESFSLVSTYTSQLS